MKTRKNLLIIFLSAVIFTLLFHRQSLGLNLFIFEVYIFSWLLFTRQFQFRGFYPVTIGLGFILSSIFYVINHSAFSLVMNILMLFAFVGLLIYPQAKSMVSSLGLSFTNLFTSQAGFVKLVVSSKLNGKSIGKRLLRLSIFIIPLIIIIIFIIIYSESNPVFNDLLCDIGRFIDQNISSIFRQFDSLIILSFFIGLLISNYIWIRIANQSIIDSDANSSVTLSPKEEKPSIISKGMINEYRSGVFLLFVLNSLLLIVNVIDIKWVWFSFSWEGQYLKQFVHEGTYLLIISILISMALVLYYFRGSLNFYKNNGLLKYLSLIWLAQNSILAISVAIRNYWYIEYFALAYKRIGVFIFLIIVIFGLYTVLFKVLRKRSTFYLLKANIFAIFMVLLLSSFINWDIVIAKYNFKHSEHSFLHLNFMASLSDKSLPYLDKPISELSEIDQIQKQLFPFEEMYMNPHDYRYIINSRKQEFKTEWETKTFLSWNLAEYLAYRKMFSSGKNIP